MDRLRHFIIASVFMIVAAGASGCVIVEDDATITCNRLDSYMASCYPTCYTNWDCEYNYDYLDYANQDLMDQCADCLQGEQSICNDCLADSYSCFELLTSYLGISCTW